MQTLNTQRVAIVGGQRIPFCRANTNYAKASNHEMMAATLRALVERYELRGQKIGDVVLGAVLKHSRDFNLAREAVLSSGLAPETPASKFALASISTLTSPLEPISFGFSAPRNSTSGPPTNAVTCASLRIERAALSLPADSPRKS